MAIVEGTSKEVAFWDTQFNYCQEARRPFEEEWYMNYAMYKGRQWILWDTSIVGSARLVEPRIPNGRVRITSNKIRVDIRREIAKLTKQEPIWYVVPATNEPNDVAAARVSQQLTEYMLTTANFKKQRRMATFWNSITGNGFVKTTCPGKNEDIVIEPIIPWQFYVSEVQTEELQKQPYVMHVRGMRKENIEAQYDIKLDKDDLSSGEFLEQRFFNAIGITQFPAKQALNLVLVKEIWVRPGAMKEYPGGALMVIAGNKLVYKYKKTEKEEPSENPLEAILQIPKKAEYPYDHGRFPFAKMDHIPSGSFYSTSVIVDLTPIQKERNRTRSQMIESKNRTSNPKLMFQKGSIDPAMITGQPGQMLPVNPGFDYPRFLEGAQAPVVQAQEIDLLDRDMDAISANSEVSRGSAPPDIEAASAIAYLQEENDTVLHYTIESIADCIQEVGRQALELSQQFWDEPHIIDIVSKNATQEAGIWKTEDIGKNKDIRIEVDSIAPISRAAKQAFITGLMKDGIIPAEKGLRYLQMNETNRLYEELQADSRQACRENYTMARNTKPQGAVDPETGLPAIDPQTGESIIEPMKPLTVNPWDNHEVHIYEHGLFLKSQECEQLPPEIRTLIANHWMQHYQALNPAMSQAPVQEGEQVATGAIESQSEYPTAGVI